MTDEENKKIKNVKQDEKAPKNEKEQSEQQETVTIMPTMIDESEEKKSQKRDLSAIIPKFEEETTNPDAIELVSKDIKLKSDGAVSIALVNGDGSINVIENITLPEQIDIEQRKKEKQKNKNRNKKNKERKKSKVAQQIQNRTALISLIIIIALAGAFYWYKKHPTEKDFQPLHVEVEIGESLPIRTSNYVKPGIGKEVDELQYALDLSEVVLEEVGDYEFKVTYKNITKTGTVSIVDTKPPELTVRNFSIREGETYDASSFVLDCKDPNGCNYSFLDTDTTKKITSPGSHTVYVVATDAFQNSVTKQANLIIENAGELTTFSKSTTFDITKGYELTENYNLYFNTYSNHSVLINGSIYEIQYKYHDEEVYEKDKKELDGEVNYSFDDSQKVITYRQTINTVGSNYTDLIDIDNYLTREGFYKRG